MTTPDLSRERRLWCRFLADLAAMLCAFALPALLILNAIMWGFVG